MICTTKLGVKDYVCKTDSRDVEVCWEYAEDPDPPASLEFLEAAEQFMEDQHMTMVLPLTVPAALDLYVDITTYFDQQI